MKIDFINQLYKEIEKTKKYENPFVIMLSGPPGAGKTYFSKELSRKLKIYLLSTDYVRNFFYQFENEYTEDNRISIEEKVKSINDERLQILVDNNISMILDSCQNNLDVYNQCMFDKYRKLLIEIVSENDEVNIERIQSREIDYIKKDETIIGDNVAYSGSYTGDVYYQIKNRKNNIIPKYKYDFIIENDGTLEEYNIKIETLIEKIKKNLNL